MSRFEFKWARISSQTYFSISNIYIMNKQYFLGKSAPRTISTYNLVFSFLYLMPVFSSLSFFLTFPHPSLLHHPILSVAFLTVFSQYDFLLEPRVRVDFDYARQAQPTVIFCFSLFLLHSVSGRVFLTHNFSLFSTRHSTRPLPVQTFFVVILFLK